MEYGRILDLNEITARKSAFLFGPRSSGKTFLYSRTLKATRVYNLLDTRVLKALSMSPGLIFEQCVGPGELIVVDEVQKVPHLLNEVHRTIEEKGARFLLTGSSARKLKRSQANLLGGRATMVELLPLTYAEIPEFDLIRFLNHGGIPRHYLAGSADYRNELEDYVSLYLKEEIKDEAITRNLDDFARFLEVMALHSGDELAIEAFSSDCQIKASTFRNYLQVLKDTLIGFEVPPYLASRRRKAITRSKFYLFDVGVANHLAQRESISKKGELFGRAFEHLIAMELRAYLTYRRVKAPLCYWRSKSQFEVDFVVGRKLAVEVKGKERVQQRDLRGLRALREEKQIERFVVVSGERTRRSLDKIEIFPWETFLKELWAGSLI